MTALYIIGGILLLLLVILMLRFKIHFLYYGKVLSLKLGVLCFMFKQDLAGTEDADVQIEDIRKKQKPKGKGEGKKPKKNVLLKDTLIILRDGVFGIKNRFKKHLRLEKYVLKINLGTDDPAKTAILYGALSGVVCSLHELAESIKNRARKADSIYTEFKPDFYADKTDIAVEIGFSMRVWQYIACLLVLLRSYGKYRRLQGKPEKNTKGETQDERILS